MSCTDVRGVYIGKTKVRGSKEIIIKRGEMKMKAIKRGFRIIEDKAGKRKFLDGTR
jgi:hypothetical protein